MEAATAPSWVTKDVIPAVSGHVRDVQMLSDKSAILFLDDHVVVAHKGAMSGVKITRADYPTGLLINGSRCPNCEAPLREPIGKIARLAPAAPEPVPRAKGRKGKR